MITKTIEDVLSIKSQSSLVFETTIVSVCDFAISQDEEIERLRRERDEWKEKYLSTREGRLNSLRESGEPK